MNCGSVKYVGTILDGYQTKNFDSGRTYFFQNSKPGKYDIYDIESGRLIETVGLRTFNKCFEGLNLPKYQFGTPILKVGDFIKLPGDDRIYQVRFVDPTNPTNPDFYQIVDYTNKAIEIIADPNKWRGLFPKAGDVWVKLSKQSINEGLSLPKKTIWPSRIIGNLYEFLISRPFANYCAIRLIKNDIIIDKNNKRVVITEGKNPSNDSLLGIWVSLYGEKNEYLFVHPTMDKLYRLTIEDVINNFLFDPTDLMEGLNLAKKPIVIELTTELLPIINVCLYGTPLDPTEFVEDTTMMSKQGADKYWEYFDWELYKDYIFNQAKLFIKEEIVPYLQEMSIGIVGINVQEFYSPKSYNITCDMLFYDLLVLPSFYRTALHDIDQQNQNELNNFLSGKYRSYSGFISYMPQSVNELKEALTAPQEYERGVAAYMAFKLKDKMKLWQISFYDHVRTNQNDLDFLRKDTPDDIIDKIVEELNGTEVDWNDDDANNVQLHEGLHLPKQTPQSWFQSILNQTTGPHTSPEYPDSLFYKLGNDVIFEYETKSHNFWVDYDKIWSVLETKFDLNYEQIEELIKPLVEEYYNLESVRPYDAFLFHDV